MSNKELEMKAQGQNITDVNGEAVAEVSETATHEAATGFKKIENGVVTGYKKIEDGVVDGFGKVVDKCVEVLFAKEGETVEEAKARLSGKREE